MMKKQTMLGICVHLKANLRELESMLGYLPIGEHACIFKYIQEVQELAAIAKYETITRATTEQARHLAVIVSRVRHLRGLLPQDTAEYPDIDQD
jgi:hypothetical protein